MGEGREKFHQHKKRGKLLCFKTVLKYGECGCIHLKTKGSEFSVFSLE